MAIEIHLPTALRAYAEKQEKVSIEGKTVGEVLRNLAGQYPALSKHLFSEEGNLRNFVNVYLNEEDIRGLSGKDTPVRSGDRLMIVPSIAGGTPPSGVAREASGAWEEVVLSQEEIQRYSRHLIMPEVGMQGQKRLKAARVLLVGAGGLGSPLGLYLAAAGVGRIGIVDFDTVEFSNLQRQVLHATQDVGRPKLESAQMRLQGVNPGVEIVPHELRLSSANALEVLKEYDVVADGTDNFPTRYLVNDACALLGKPNVYASIFRFEGQVSVFDARLGPCYRCLYPEPPPPGLVPSCAEGGVLGVLPGIVGALQALEVIKLLVGQGELLIGQLLLFDALKMEFKKLKLRKDPGCPLCGKNPTIRGLIDYEEFCGVASSPQHSVGGSVSVEEAGVPEISVQELKKRLDGGEDLVLVDVREPHEYEICKIQGSRLIPLGELPDRVHELNCAEEIVVHCRMGGRSAQAVQFLMQAGFRKVKNLKGGIDAWAREIDPSVPTY
ncbi:MAG: molybdopterin-synthase adenylyltransferase MoeB [Elusimicrobia bacterium]|nr:molybdopterin-synthase adenylyltransferase MoeB [Elusimicrobiota bacterium]